MGRFSYILILLAGVTALGSCEAFVTWVSTTKAEWSYVRDAWGGVEIGETSLREGELLIPLSLIPEKGSWEDSAICICGAYARQDGSRLLIGIRRCICGAAAGLPSVLRIPRPSPGRYEVRYDDDAAGYPLLGSIDVP